jgi:hypothetical protein
VILAGEILTGLRFSVQSGLYSCGQPVLYSIAPIARTDSNNHLR